jgi:NitT/TauT family transport system substrate-binding protein
MAVAPRELSPRRMQTVRIRLLWRPQAQFAGYHIAERLSLGAADGVGIEAQPIRFDQSGIAALAAGDAEIAVASPSHLLEASCAERLRFILTIQQETSLVYPVRLSSGIRTLTDLAGRRVGVWPGHEDLELRWMLRKAGLAKGSVTRVSMADTVAGFIAGHVDCAQMTTYHELHVAEETLGHGALRQFAAADFGASLIKDGLVAEAGWLTRNRDVAQSVVNAVLQGWTIAFTDPERAAAICAEARPDMPLEEHRAQLQGIRALSCRGPTLERGLGYPDRGHLNKVLEAMTALGMTPPAIDSASIADDSLWQATPAEWRSKAWALG